MGFTLCRTALSENQSFEGCLRDHSFSLCSEADPRVAAALALLVAGKEIRKLNFGRKDTPVSPPTAGCAAGSAGGRGG